MKKGDIVEFTCYYPVGFAASIPLWANPPRDGEIKFRGIIQDFVLDFPDGGRPIASVISEDNTVWLCSLEYRDEEWVAGDDWEKCEDCRPGAPCRYHIATPDECRAI